MSELKTDGIEFTSDDHRNRNYQGGVWGGAVGGFVGGGILGYVLGRTTNGYNNGYGMPPYGGYPGGMAPMNGGTPYNGGCSESQYVNRYEMQQQEHCGQLESQLAQEKSERYADSIGISTYERMVQYFNNQMERRDNLQNEVTRQVSALTTKEAVNDEKLNCLRDKVGESLQMINDLGRSTKAAIAASQDEIEAWTKNNFVAQPKVTLCCGEPTWKCCCNGTEATDI